MIDVASRATNGVKIPDRRATRSEIIDLFQSNLTDLRSQLNVSVLGLLLTTGSVLFVPESHCDR